MLLAAAPSATALAEQGGRLVAKATLHFRDECNLSPAVLKVELPWEVTGTIITDRVICFKDWGGWTDAEKDAVSKHIKAFASRAAADLKQNMAPAVAAIAALREEAAKAADAAVQQRDYPRSRWRHSRWRRSAQTSRQP